MLKHRVSFEEATTVFSDPRSLEASDLTHGDRVILVGMSGEQHVLFVVHAERGERIRIISARVASRAQRRRYEEAES